MVPLALAACLVMPACDSPAAESSTVTGTSIAPMQAKTLSGRTITVDRTITDGLQSPWGLAFLPDGSALVTERDSARVLRIDPATGTATPIGRVRGVVPGGEGGLLGIAVPPGPAPTTLYAYATTATDNRVLALGWNGSRITGQRPILTGIPKAQIHNGGRLAFGPDGMLYVATGDAAQVQLAGDRRSLAGKVLRITPDGKPAPGNPYRGSPVWSIGHRNIQGLAFDSSGRLLASEFGTQLADELNVIKPGRNYGWPRYEGPAKDRRFVDPIATWSPTSKASPSGIAILGPNVFVASLRGEVLWDVPLRGAGAGEPKALDLGELGRLRTVAVAPDRSLWLMTSNTDGRGDPRSGDDRLLRISVG